MHTVREVLEGERRWAYTCGDSLKSLKKMPDQSVQLIVCSPPYYALRDYNVDGQIGMEKTPSLYVARLVRIFRECRRVLRDDGIMFVNIGDTYHVKKGQAGGVDRMQPARRHFRTNRPNLPGLKPKDMIGIPWMLAFALRDDGWFLRQEIIWEKPNVMPGSAQDRFCSNHEQVFLFAKKRYYYFDVIANQEKSTSKWSGSPVGGWALNGDGKHNAIDFTGEREKKAKGKRRTDGEDLKAEKFIQHVGDNKYRPATRNKRTVWKVSTRRYKGKHFAVFPPQLVQPMIRAGTSERGCCSKCGKPVERIVEKRRIPTRPGRDTKVAEFQKNSKTRAIAGRRSLIDAGGENVVGNRDPHRHITIYETVGWKQCGCGAPLRGSIVLDPFAGSGTVLQVALENGQDAIGIELSEDYCKLIDDRMSRTTATLPIHGDSP